MSWFSKKPDPKEEMKQQKRTLTKSKREMEREIGKLDREEAKLQREIKAAAKRGDNVTAKALAKQLVQTRNLKTRQYQAKSQIMAVQGRTTTAQATMRTANVMKKTTNVMAKMNASVNMQEIQATLQKFEQESTKMDLGQEIMDDTLDSIFDDEEEADGLVDQIFTEIGVDVSNSMTSVPTNSLQAPKETHRTAAKDEESDLMARLAMLQ